jgi:hypothetical protein
MWFAIKSGNPVPSSVYVVLYDRECDTQYISNCVPIRYRFLKSDLDLLKRITIEFSKATDIKLNNGQSGKKSRVHHAGFDKPYRCLQERWSFLNEILTTSYR